MRLEFPTLPRSWLGILVLVLRSVKVSGSLVHVLLRCIVAPPAFFLLRIVSHGIHLNVLRPVV